MSNQPQSHVADERLPFDLVISALRAVDAEARRRGEMYPQTATEQREDRQAMANVIETLQFYSRHDVTGWPTLPRAASTQAETPKPDEEVFAAFNEGYAAGLTAQPSPATEEQGDAATSAVEIAGRIFGFKHWKQDEEQKARWEQFAAEIRSSTEAQGQVGATDASLDSQRVQFLIDNPHWSVRWRIHTKQQIQQWQMVDDGEPWGQWGKYRAVVDKARVALAPANSEKTK